MRLDELTTPELIVPALDAVDRASVLRSMAGTIARHVGLDADLLYRQLDEREELGSTAIGNGVAIPHCRMAGIDEVVLALGVSRRPIDFGADDDEPVRLFFVVVAPSAHPAAHLRCLQSISRWMKDRARMQQIVALDDAHALYHLLGTSGPTT